MLIDCLTAQVRGTHLFFNYLFHRKKAYEMIFAKSTQNWKWSLARNRQLFRQWYFICTSVYFVNHNTSVLWFTVLWFTPKYNLPQCPGVRQRAKTDEVTRWHWWHLQHSVWSMVTGQFSVVTNINIYNLFCFWSKEESNVGNSIIFFVINSCKLKILWIEMSMQSLNILEGHQFPVHWWGRV